VIDAGEHAGARPSVEMALHRRIRRKLFRQLPPLAAGGGHIQDGVHDRSQFRFAWAAKLRCGRKQRLDQRPFRIRQIACVSQPVSAILPPGDFRQAICFPRISRIRRNHNLLKSPNFFSSQPLKAD